MKSTIIPLSIRRNKKLWMLMIAIVVFLNIGTKNLSNFLPETIIRLGTYTLYAVLIFFVLGLFLNKNTTGKIAMYAIIACFGVEFLQQIPFDWLVQLKKTDIGKIIFKQNFWWTDLFSYTLGIGEGALIEKFVLNRNSKSKLSLRTLKSLFR